MTGQGIVPGKILKTVLGEFALAADRVSVSPIGSGYIHQTFLLKSGEARYVLQRVNKNVFTRPDVIAANLKSAARHLKEKYPEFLFMTPRETPKGGTMVYDTDGFPWRIFPYFENTYTIDRVENARQAYSAASEFARLARYLDDADVSEFKPTIDRFHDLAWRFSQFEASLENGVPDRLREAGDAIGEALRFRNIVDEYTSLVNTGKLRLRITHNDTKINNILFDSTTNEAVAAIDLDTLMPGYFIYDTGDMIRTFVSPVDEEERDLSRIVVRRDIYDAIREGYFSQMGDRLCADEKHAFDFSGRMMTYIMALRMLADYNLGDVYYRTSYPEQNLIRARNQFRLLTLLSGGN